MTLRLDVVGLTELKASLAAFVDLIDDFDPLWERLSEIMVDVEREQFESEGHGLWPPLSPHTVSWKARHGYPPDPLIRTGALLESLLDPSQAMRVEQGRSTIGTFTSKAMSWGTDVRDDRGREYAIYHQGVDAEGLPTDYGDRPPLRRVIDVGPADEARFFEAAQDFARQVLRESGLEPRED